MDKETLVLQLRKMDLEHATDGDGGYALVRAVLTLSDSLDDESRRCLWDVLTDLVMRRDKTLWGVALEVMIQKNQGGERLLIALSSGVEDAEWRDQIVLGLLRLAWQPATTYCAKYIGRALSNGRRTVLPLLAALSRVNIKMCVDMASSYFAGALIQEGGSEVHRGYIPAFVRNFLEVDKSIFRDLIERTSRQNAVAGEKLRTLFDGCLSLPAYSREYGVEVIAALRGEINDA
ncbi:MAG: hypothetical protein ACK4SX_00995 [Alcanivoracaceae bacterium]